MRGTDAATDGLAARIAERNRDRHPVTVAAIVGVVGYVIVGAIVLGLGLLLTHVLLSGGLGRWDEHVEDWFVARRTLTWNDVTAVGTAIGSTGTVIAVAAVAVAILAFRRLWRDVALIVVALAVEVLVFLMTTFVVDRPRPSVPQLDASPPTSSFPSGHTAAAIALWVSLAIVISGHVRNALVRLLVWAVAVAVPTFVAVSRLYRGMHHPTDVAGSVILGAGAIVTAILAADAAADVAAIRRAERSGAAPAPASAEPRVEVAS